MVVLDGGVDRVTDDGIRDACRVTLAGEHCGQPAGLHLRVEAAHGSQLLGDELLGTSPLGLVVEGTDASFAKVIVDPLLA